MIKLFRLIWISLVFISLLVVLSWILLFDHVGDISSCAIDRPNYIHLIGRIENTYESAFLLKDPSGSVWIISERPPRTPNRWVWIKGQVKAFDEKCYIKETRRVGTF
jgi:hypothetical protein